ncbi:unnamed protein product [Durusdinium trenchii]|uniref:DNA (cytosine-5-)-methyltransferase n=1 Tax=Durusdinium trenchii TaxID=1381693 RepID=A0ABP0PFU2_9DINO
MGKRGRDSDAATWSTHVAYFEHVAPAHECLIVENVPEYSEMLVLKCLKKSGYSWQAKSLRIDPRVLGLGCARARLYMVIFRTDIFRWEPNFTLEQLVECLAGQVALSAGSYYWAKLPPVKLSTAQEKNRQDYRRTTKLQFMDLSQYPKNGRGRGETKDGALPTLTTTTGSLWSEAHQRCLSSDELLSSHVLPVTRAQATKCHSPRLKFDGCSNASKVKMAGNGMSVPCMGVAMMGAAIALERIDGS